MGLFDFLKGLGGGKSAEDKRMEKLRQKMPGEKQEEKQEDAEPAKKPLMLFAIEDDEPAEEAAPVIEKKPAEEKTEPDGFNAESYAMPKLDLSKFSAFRDDDEGAPVQNEVEEEANSLPEPEKGPEPEAEKEIDVKFFDFGVPEPEKPAVEEKKVRQEPQKEPQKEEKSKLFGGFGFLFKKAQQKTEEPEKQEIKEVKSAGTDEKSDEPAVDTRTDMERLADQIQERYPMGIKSLYSLQSDMQFGVEIRSITRNQEKREELKRLLSERKLLQTAESEQGESDGVTEVTAELFEQFMNRLVSDNQGMLFSFTQVVDSAFFRNTLPLYENFCRENYDMALEDYLIVRRKLAADRAKLEELGQLKEFAVKGAEGSLLEDYARRNSIPFEFEPTAEGHIRRLQRIVRVTETEKGNNCYAALKLRIFETVTLLREPEGRVAVYNCDNELCGYIDPEDQQWVTTAMEQAKITLSEPVVVEHSFVSDAGKFRRKTIVSLYFKVEFDERKFVLYGLTPFDSPRYFAPAPKEPQRSPEGYYIMNLDNSPEVIEVNDKRIEGLSLRTCDDLSDWEWTVTPEKTVQLKGYSGEETKLTLPSSIDSYPVTEIGKDAFSGNGKIVSVRIPGSIKLLRENAFRGCAELVSVSIGEGCEQLDRNVFSDCPKLTKCVSPKSLVEITDNTPFSNTPWRDETSEEFLLLGSILLSWQGRGYRMRIPGGVTVYARGAAFGNPNLREVVFPDGMVKISEQAFYPGNKQLKKITVPLSVRRIGENAFRGTKWLTDHTDELLVINDLLLRYRGESNTVHLDESIHVICDGAFKGCGVERLWLEDTLTDVCDGAFYKCEALRTVSVGNGLRYIGASAFALCKSLTGFYLPEKIEYIGEKAFWGCAMLEEVQYPKRLIAHGKDAFIGTPHITKSGEFAIAAGRLLKYTGNASSVSVPEGVTEIAPRVFAGIRNLVEITLPDSLLKIGREAFADCVCLYEVKGGSKVAEIENGAFKNCRSLLKIALPAELKVIGSEAFLDTDVRSVTLPKDLRYVGAGAFGGKSELTVYDQLGVGDFGTGKLSLAAVLLKTKNGVPYYDADTTEFAPITITVRAALSGSVKYSFYFDGRNESRAYRELILNCWGRKSEMSWAEFDRTFMKIRNPETRLKNAYDRLKSSPAPEEGAKDFYKSYLGRVLEIPDSEQCAAKYIFGRDDKNMLALIMKLGTVADEKRERLREMAKELGAEKCEKLLTKV
ncbi:MAG: leucine-rich repeat protein [Oscillospiraceae bacterium]|nr:leucine-rich repeat protein [Oscillospiraceae bacterium]